jgi:hypothetical protein
MKTSLFQVCLCMLCVALAPAHAWYNSIGLYANPDGTGNDIVVRPGASTTAYFVVHAPHFPEGVVGVEFSVPDWPESGPACTIALDWPGTATIGDIATGLAICVSGPTWPWPLDGNGNVVIGTATFCAYEEDWLSGDGHFEFSGWQNHRDSDPIKLVDINFDTYIIEGDEFWISQLRTPVLSMTVSALKALY